MAWTVEVSDRARRALRKLDRQTAQRIGDFIDSRLNGVADPRKAGKSLHARLDRYWAYRVGDYRLICEIRDDVLIVLVVEIGHRSNIYK